MATKAIVSPSKVPVVRRTYLVRRDHDEAIQAMRRRTGDSWSSIVRRALDLGLAAELESMRERRIPEADVA